MIRAVIFDWGNTLMRDFGLPGPMKDWDRTEVIAGVKEALHRISGEYLCAVATGAGNSDTADMVTALDRAGLTGYFRHFFSANDLGMDKDDPRFYPAVAEGLGMPPADCVMVGDSLKRDVIPARAAGMKAVLFDEQGRNPGCPEADAVIMNFAGLPEMLQSLSGKKR